MDDVENPPASAAGRHKPRLEVVYRRIEELKLDPRNPRRHSRKQIKQLACSIASFGFTVPALVDHANNVIAGHGRILACQELGWSEIPTIVLEGRSQHELVFVFKTGSGPHRNNVQLGRFGRNRSNVWRYPGVNSFSRKTEEGNLLALHPTVKPVALVADAILDCTARGDIVLDGFLGSGTTVIAAERTGRRCYGMELDPAYVDTIIRRWQKLTGGFARHAASGRTFDDLAGEAEVADAA
jgi:hypothetical protein